MVEAIYKCKNCGAVMLDFDRTEEERSILTPMDNQYHLCVANDNVREWGLLEHIGFHDPVDKDVKNTN